MKNKVAVAVRAVIEAKSFNRKNEALTYAMSVAYKAKDFDSFDILSQVLHTAGQDVEAIAEGWISPKRAAVMTDEGVMKAFPQLF